MQTVPHFNLTIRDFAPADRDAVIDLVLSLQRYEIAFAPDHAAPTQDFGEWYFERVLNEVHEKEGALLVAVSDSALCGFAAGFEEEDPKARSRAFYIAELSVAEAMRGCGIGSRLIAAMEDFARAHDLNTVVIGVLAGSARVHRLYNRLGYRDHAVKLRKKL